MGGFKGEPTGSSSLWVDLKEDQQEALLCGWIERKTNRKLCFVGGFKGEPTGSSSLWVDLKEDQQEALLCGWI